MKVIIHGENALIPVNELPKDARAIKGDNIVGHSESGHNHVLEAGKFTIYETTNGDRFVEVLQTAQLVHQKSFEIHETLQVKPSIRQINHKTEYDPFAKVIRRVFD